MTKTNARERFFAHVSADKSAEDDHNRQGFCRLFFPLEDKADRDENKLAHDAAHRLSYQYRPTQCLENKEYMYVVGKKGSLYISDQARVHSELKNSREVQSAGWLTIADDQISIIDNKSGHYMPTLGQFLLTVTGLIQEGYIRNPVNIALSLLTKIEDSFNLPDSLKKNFNTKLTVELIKDTNQINLFNGGTQILGVTKAQLNAILEGFCQKENLHVNLRF